ncbi:hypothetical protein Y032_0032g2454 [Ancylostoma ceylanicum]|uniref:Uncharacterized protein n=1 Tax=Ancylostoma ceylanicum TaxID=53326 RepID=A0A016UNG1_9BILA|nr:hypothetical protein Y032_0032g2454 [Ancylostoma ceylanicum]
MQECIHYREDFPITNIIQKKKTPAQMIFSIAERLKNVVSINNFTNVKRYLARVKRGGLVRQQISENTKKNINSELQARRSWAETQEPTYRAPVSLPKNAAPRSRTLFMAV